ncbi:hypothetical protein [Emcibacter sp. SYSU 3D8]|uniref:hypothetical protein n=1 Tax=Emcibacter sp. SYSU 3D8 TaxID=3133969 RepID=UPI0031FF2C8C
MSRPPDRAKPVRTAKVDERTSLQRYRDADKAQQATSGVGEPPQSLSDAEAGCWRELIALSGSMVLTGADRWRVEMVSRLMATVRSGEFKDFELRSLDRLLGQMGIPLAEFAHPAPGTA